MDLRRIIIFIVVALIPIAIVIYVYVEDSRKFSHLEQCDNDSCVRLCCTKESRCDNETSDLLDTDIGANLKESFVIIHGNPCPFEHTPVEDVVFEKNGMINESGDIFDWNNYCLYFNDSEPIIHLCLHMDFVGKIRLVYPYFMIASIPFLLITLFVYGYMKELRNLHGKCLISYVGSLTMMYLCIVIITMGDESLSEYKSACTALGYTKLASIFYCFFWLNVMCYDIWVTFRRRPRSDNIKTYLKYCSYGFGVPTIIVLLIFILNVFELIPDKFNNGIGHGTCDVHTIISNDVSDHRLVHLIYLYLPIAFFLLLNMVFYGITAYKIYSVYKETKICQARKHSAEQKDRLRFTLYLRLFIVMGIPWLLEVISFGLDDSPIFIVISFLNCMQGFIIFMTFVCKSNVRKMLERKHVTLSVRYRKTKSSTVGSVTEASKINLESHSMSSSLH